MVHQKYCTCIFLAMYCLNFERVKNREKNDEYNKEINCIVYMIFCLTVPCVYVKRRIFIRGENEQENGEEIN